jgi:hypothetical protein
MKKAILSGVDRVQRIRQDIQQKALVNDMPPVRVFDAAWTGPGGQGTIFGRSTALRIAGRWELGVELAAPTVVYPDDKALRGVLLHEFSHCFNRARRIIENLAAGGGPIIEELSDGFFDDDEGDRQQLEPPEAWFGADDVAIFPYWHSRLLDESADKIQTEWIGNGLPSVVPNLRFRFDRVGIPKQWWEKIEHRMRP